MNTAEFACCGKSRGRWTTATACAGGLSRGRMWQQGGCPVLLGLPAARHPIPSPITPWAGESPRLWDCSSHLCWLSRCCPGSPWAAGISQPGFWEDDTICCRAPRCQVRGSPGAKDTRRESATFGEWYTKHHLSSSCLCSSPCAVSSVAPRAHLGRTPVSSQQQQTLARPAVTHGSPQTHELHPKWAQDPSLVHSAKATRSKQIKNSSNTKH